MSLCAKIFHFLSGVEPVIIHVETQLLERSGYAKLFELLENLGDCSVYLGSDLERMNARMSHLGTEDD